MALQPCIAWRGAPGRAANVSFMSRQRWLVSFRLTVCAGWCEMAEFSDKPWGSISEADYRDADAFCAACLIDLNPPGKDKTKANCKLPVKEPGGAYNRNAIHAAAAALAGARGGVQAPPEEKRRAARALIRLYRQMNEEPPESLKQIAGA